MTEKENEILKAAAEEADSELNNEFLTAFDAPELEKEFKYADRYKNKTESKKRITVKRVLITAASFIIIFGIAVAVTLSPASGYRQNIMELIRDLRSSTHENIGFYSDESEKLLKKYNGKYIPSWIPREYEVTKVTDSDAVKTIVLESKDGSVIFTEYDIPNNVNIDNENVLKTETFKYNGMDVTKYYKEGKIEVVIITDDTLLIIVSTDNNFNIDQFINCIEKNK